MFKKFILSLLSAILLLVTIVPYFSPARAQTWYHQPYGDWYDRVYNPDNPEEIFGERYTAAQVEWVVYGLVAFLMNNIGNPELTACLLEDHANLAAVLADCGAEILDAANDLNISKNTNPTSSFLATITNRPISGIEYFKDVAGRLNLIPEVQAQTGFGFEAARPVLELWRFVRNTTYFLLIIVLIVMAFMIMFRVRISPQTVITVQSALPKVIIALVLITFSYAIAGFLIDLMYVVMGLLAGIISSSPVSNLDWLEMYTALTQRGVLELMFSYLFLFSMILYSAMFSSGIVPFFLASTVIIPMLIVLIVLVILLLATFRILWLMLKTYVMILLQIIMGPILILLGTIGPGGFGSWLRGILAHLAVYPTVAFMFVLAFVFLRGAYPSGLPAPLESVLNSLFTFDITSTVGGSTPWNAPFTIGDVASQEIIWLFVSLAVILLIPNIANIIQGMLSRRPFSMGTAIGEALGPAAMPYTTARGAIGEYAAGRVARAGPDTEGLPFTRWHVIQSLFRGRR